MRTVFKLSLFAPISVRGEKCQEVIEKKLDRNSKVDNHRNKDDISIDLRFRRVVLNSRSKKISFKKRKCKKSSTNNKKEIRCTGKNNVSQNTRLMNAGKSKLKCVYFNTRSVAILVFRCSYTLTSCYMLTAFLLVDNYKFGRIM